MGGGNSGLQKQRIVSQAVVQGERNHTNYISFPQKRFHPRTSDVRPSGIFFLPGGLSTYHEAVHIRLGKFLRNRQSNGV